ncbi:alpha/beta hydrolase [Amycolatopsis sp. H20-H5]|uniref:alpha/beta hydrolase n=1 Tax=Amycolatopsis sp. H20-H5 TaxID=3046309 RepID=UPI002DB6573E|nr:alpha/beta hydrolase [Amycolatopsis sp. H20-H5]MEC3977438.1 alpha/beta hydrolase [Amycolatopsis sp. H20-H5]
MRLHKAVRRAGSLRSQVAAAVTFATVRPLAGVLPANRAGVVVSRRVVAISLAIFGPPLRGSRVERVDQLVSPDLRVRGEWVRGPSGTTDDDAVILYLHGSGYAICSSRTHRGLTTRLSALTGLPVFSCDYRLAPSHRFPCAADDVRAAYEWLLSEGRDPARIVVAGDSAGGHLAVDLISRLLQEGWVAPAALVLFSPLLDLSLAGAALRERVRPDPMISAARAARLVGLYVGDHDPSTPRLRLHIDGRSGFPPTLIQAGGREMLAADAVELSRRLGALPGAVCALEIWPGQMHVFQALPRIVPEAKRALARAGDFVVRQLDIADRDGRAELVKEA